MSDRLGWMLRSIEDFPRGTPVWVSSIMFLPNRGGKRAGKVTGRGLKYPWMCVRVKVVGESKSREVHVHYLSKRRAAKDDEPAK